MHIASSTIRISREVWSAKCGLSVNLCKLYPAGRFQKGGGRSKKNGAEALPLPRRIPGT